MRTNRDRFDEITDIVESDTLQKIKERNNNRYWLRESRRISAKVLVGLKEKNMTQKDLAEKMEVTPQYINKIVKGGENLTLRTIVKLQDILDIEILSPYIPSSSQQKEGVMNAPLISSFSLNR